MNGEDRPVGSRMRQAFEETMEREERRVNVEEMDRVQKLLATVGPRGPCREERRMNVEELERVQKLLAGVELYLAELRECPGWFRLLSANERMGFADFQERIGAYRRSLPGGR